ncbi:MAG: peptidoglycan DD-metalloendopeptidase family protein [SAR324 cluster bacterium]|nr:peptidoglycan DD-metalloendopeptidase family protein [SAR324 cluster bacterium]
MKEFSILFLKTPDSVARQISFSHKLVYISGCLFVGMVMSLISLYFFQHQQITDQREQIQQHETARMLLQKEIDEFAEKEERIRFLESYVEELKTTTYASENALKQHIVLYKSSVNKLKTLHNYICQTMSMKCSKDIQNSNNAETIIAWMDGVSSNFQNLGKAVKDFYDKKTSAEEQESTIRHLRMRIVQTEQKLAKHLELVKTKEKAIDQLSKRIHDVTGISFNLTNQFLPKETSSSNGRGGPVHPEFNPDLFTEDSYLERYLDETTTYYESVVKSVASLSNSIEQDSELWKHTPTIRPVQTRSISDRYGKRMDPFTKKPDFHSGVDFTGRRGTPIRASADGFIVKANYQVGYGRFVEIKHGLGFYKNKHKKVYTSTRYGHLHEIKVKQGQVVKRGDIIGTLGNTGRSTGPHLHYEIIINNRHVNPLNLISHFESHTKKRGSRK